MHIPLPHLLQVVLLAKLTFSHLKLDENEGYKTKDLIETHKLLEFMKYQSNLTQRCSASFTVKGQTKLIIKIPES